MHSPARGTAGPLKRFYDWLMAYAHRPQAPWVMAGLAFAESSFFPLPAEPLLVAMILANRSKAWRWAALATLASVTGGLLGYILGAYLYDSVGHWVVDTYGMEEAFARVQQDFRRWGFWIIVLKGLTPIPYKVVTIASGVVKLDLPTFLWASFLSRGMRFFCLSLLLWYYGAHVQRLLERSLGTLVLTGLGLLVGGVLMVKWLC